MPLWPVIPVQNFIAPLLYMLIGIWNDIWNRFREIISEEIEYIDPEEAEARLKRTELEIRIALLKNKRNSWKEASEDGKVLKSAKSKLTRLRRVAKNLRKLACQPSVDNSDASSMALFLLECDAIIEQDTSEDDTVIGICNEDSDVEEDAGDKEQEETEAVEGQEATVVPNANAFEAKLVAVMTKIKEVEKVIAEKGKSDRKHSSAINRANAMLKLVKENISIFKAGRRKDENGIETQIYDYLKAMYCIQLPVYHGGASIGKDCVKIMGNAGNMFTHFSGTLKLSKKNNCSLTDPMIDEMCADFRRHALLWDGCFSLVRRVNPSRADIVKYERFEIAATFSHQAMQLSTPHKVHVGKHAAKQMRLPGGIPKKAEDWLEAQHQEGTELHQNYPLTVNVPKKATAVARSVYRDTNSAAVATHEEVHSETKRGPRKDDTSVEEAKRKLHEFNRHQALLDWEGVNQTIIFASTGDVCRSVSKNRQNATKTDLVAVLPAVGVDRVYKY